MARLIVIALLVGLGLWWVARRLRQPPQQPGAMPQPGGAAKAGAQPHAMLSCAHCGLHFARDDGVGLLAGSKPSGQATDAAYCCEEHRRLGPSAP